MTSLAVFDASDGSFTQTALIFGGSATSATPHNRDLGLFFVFAGARPTKPERSTWKLRRLRQCGRY
jgi:hypothetical protein